ncbi:effector-associated domain EAD1-containing protein [Pseudofrankia saprophytica]|uniref:effector-associated domain EAD1-containing protein n=1 Tax=Pseudofrankia saprophytica TaxID=298655 RepID=UPI000234BCBF|nr:effector-associated domain EAD1-containing protein [Pseudofrankia saprophytica]
MPADRAREEGLTDSEVVALAKAFPDQPAAVRLLRRGSVGFPEDRIPWAISNGYEFWSEVGRLLEHGVISGGATRILVAAGMIFPANSVFGQADTALVAVRRGGFRRRRPGPKFLFAIAGTTIAVVVAVAVLAAFWSGDKSRDLVPNGVRFTAGDPQVEYLSVDGMAFEMSHADMSALDAEGNRRVDVEDSAYAEAHPAHLDVGICVQPVGHTAKYKFTGQRMLPVPTGECKDLKKVPTAWSKQYPVPEDADLENGIRFTVVGSAAQYISIRGAVLPIMDIGDAEIFDQREGNYSGATVESGYLDRHRGSLPDGTVIRPAGGLEVSIFNESSRHPVVDASQCGTAHRPVYAVPPKWLATIPIGAAVDC